MELQGKIKLEVLKNYFKVMQSLTDELIIGASEDGLLATAVDGGHAAMANVILKAGAFEEYTSSEGEFAININKAVDFIGLGKKGDIAIIGVDDTTLSITIGYLNKKIRLLDTENLSRAKLAELSYDCHVTLRRADFGNGVKAGGDVSQAIELSLTEDMFAMRGEGDTDAVKMELPQGPAYRVRCWRGC